MQLNLQKCFLLVCALAIGLAIGFTASAPFFTTNKQPQVELNENADRSEAYEEEEAVAVAFLRNLGRASTEEDANRSLEVMKHNFAANLFAVLKVKEFDEELIGPDSVLGFAVLDVAWRSPEKAKEWLWERGAEWRRAWFEANITRCPGEIATAALESVFSPDFEGAVYSESLTKQLVRFASNTDGTNLLELLANRAPDKLAALDYEKLDFADVDVDTALRSLPPHERSRFSQAYALSHALTEDGIEASMHWLQDHVADGERDQAVSAFLDGVIRRAPSEVADKAKLNKLALSPSQQVELVRQFSHLNHDAARAWGESLPDGSEKLRIMALIGTQPWASAAEQTAAFDYLKSSPNDPMMMPFAEELVVRSSGLEDAVSLMESFPVGSLAAQKAVNTMMESFAGHDPMAASEILASIPRENLSDHAIEDLISAIPDDPVGAFSWSLQIASPEKRASLIGEYGAAVYSSDQEQFYKIIESAGLGSRTQKIMEEIGNSNN